MKKVAFVFVAEPYQCYHGAAVAFVMAKMADVQVTIYYNDPDSVYHLDRIRALYSAAPINYIRMKRSLSTTFIQSLKVFGFLKYTVYRSNERALAQYDAIVSVEDTAYRLFERSNAAERPRKIYIPHGAGDGIVGFSGRAKHFDLVLLPGPKSVARMLESGYIRSDNYRAIGLVKLETADLLNDSRDALFAVKRPTVLYNSHITRGLRSWDTFIEPMLAAFAESDDYNLIVAPHVKFFRRRSRRLRAKWKARSSGNVIVDTGSDHSVDMSYTRTADIYVGDISSQIYEFLVEPRPCVFLNPHRIAWETNPSYAHWHLGDVITEPEQLMPAIRAAKARHPVYLPRQAAMANASLGDRSPGASHRAAKAIVEFLRDQERL
jgi:CDP-Glycerol:Poly(glycerophosphate) glycerophosphotransferase